MEQEEIEQKKPLENWLIVIVSIILLIFILGYAVANPEKRSSETIIMTLLSLSGAGFTVFFTGKMKIEGKIKIVLVEAGGPLAVFFIIFYSLVGIKEPPVCDNLTNMKQEIVLFKRDLENTYKNLEQSKNQEQDLDKKKDIGSEIITIESTIRNCEGVLLPRLIREIDSCKLGTYNPKSYNEIYSNFQDLKNSLN